MPAPPPPPPPSNADLQTLVSTLQNLVKAINGLTTMLTAALAGIYDPNGGN